MTRTGIIYAPEYLDHLTPEGHPESAKRLERIYTMLAASDVQDRFIRIHPRPATQQEILMAHTPDYYQKIAATQTRDVSSLTPDTRASRGSFRAASMAVGGMFEAIEGVMAKRIANAFVLARPPGHHAEPSRAMGFCLFNNVALGALFARRVMGLKKVLIVDWDVHHGNGTQHIFENDPTVLFFSTHQYPHYPGTGLFTEIGRGKGEGYTVNIPLPKGYGDAEFIAVYQALLRPIALMFGPELILVSAGFDIHEADPMGKMKVTPEGFAGLTRLIMEISRECQAGLVLCLEGGYNVDALTDSVKAVIFEMTGHTRTQIQTLAARANAKKVTYAIKRALHVHGQTWKGLK